jgi:hypothetical protein
MPAGSICRARAAPTAPAASAGHRALLAHVARILAALVIASPQAALGRGVPADPVTTNLSTGHGRAGLSGHGNLRRRSPSVSVRRRCQTWFHMVRIDVVHLCDVRAVFRLRVEVHGSRRTSCNAQPQLLNQVWMPRAVAVTTQVRLHCRLQRRSCVAAPSRVVAVLVGVEACIELLGFCVRAVLHAPRVQGLVAPLGGRILRRHPWVGRQRISLPARERASWRRWSARSLGALFWHTALPLAPQTSRSSPSGLRLPQQLKTQSSLFDSL